MSVIAVIKDKIKGILELPFVRNTLKLSSSSVILMFLPLLVTPILSRLYTPADYGDWGVFSSVYYIIIAFIFLSYENTIVKCNNKQEIPNLILLCLLVSGIVILGVGLFFYLGRSFNLSFCLNFPSVPLLLALLAIYVLHTLINNLANREMLYGKMAISGVINGVSQAVLRITFGVWPIVTYGLIVGNLLAQVIATLFLAIFLFRVIDSKMWKHFSLRQAKNLAVEYKKFPLFDAPARLIEFAIGNLSLLIMAHFWSKDDIGSYSMIVQFILLPITMIGSAMANVYYRELSDQVNNPKHISTATKRAAKITFYISTLPMLFLALGGDKLLVIFLGKQWVVAGKLALCLVIYSVPVILSEPLLPIFRSLDKQEERFKLNLLCLVLSLGGLIASALLTQNIYLSVIIYAALYAFVRYLMYFRELKIAGISVKDISPYFFTINIASYLFLTVRLLFLLK